ATSEAAPARNAGRGFGVVTSEIRKLAEETSANRQAIRGTLDANLAQVHTAVVAGSEMQKLLATVIHGVQDIHTLLNEQLDGTGHPRVRRAQPRRGQGIAGQPRTRVGRHGTSQGKS